MGTTCPAHVYIFQDRYRSLLILEPWSLEIFRRERLDSYLGGSVRHSEEASSRCDSL